MMKLRNIAQKFKKTIFKQSSLSSNPIVVLKMDEGDLIVNCETDNSSSKYFLIVKHRISEKTLEKKVGNGKIKISVDELLSLGPFGVLDLYFKVGSDLIRIKTGSKKHINAEFKDKNCILKSYATQYGNLSITVEKTDFDYKINSLDVSDDSIVITGDFDFIKDEDRTEFFIEIKNRKTGKRIDEKVTSNTVSFNLDEMLCLDDSPNFDLYFKSKFGANFDKKRIKYNREFQFFKAVSKNKSRVLKAFSTGKNNLSFKQEERFFDCNISDLNAKNGELQIKGELEILDSEITNVDKIELIAKNRENNADNIFDLTFSQSEGKYAFEGSVSEIYSGEKIVNLRLDFFLRVYCDGIYYQNVIDLSNFTSYERKENRFLVKIDYKDNIYSYYATENNHSLALWITTETSWNKSFEVTKGKTIYDETAAEYDLDSKMVFFESFFGKSYSGNPKYIYEAMLEMGMDKEYTFVWAYSGENKDIIPGNPIIVDRYEAGDYYRYLARAKYWVNNILFPIHKKRRGNVYLQTWHGTPLKKLGYDITIPGPEVEARKNFYKESRNWDYLISSNEYSSEIFKRAFKFEKEVLEMGYPINDIFFRDNAEMISNIKSEFGIDGDKKIILYAPTWKDDEQNESWEHYFNLEIDLKRLYEQFGDEYVILLKMHHLVSENLEIDGELKDFAVDVSGWDDIQQLYVTADILITDYSSVFFDYAHSRKPILFFVPDLEHYVSNVRGLYLNMKKELPGPLIKDNDELIDAIKNIADVESEYSEKYDEFYERFCSLCKGSSGKDIVDLVFK